MKKSVIFLFLLTTLSVLTSFNMPGKPEYGKAGFYSDKFQGRPTSSGERYDKNQLTCAHNTHTFGTRLRVTRVDNGKFVEVRVNDRGPFIDGYVVDLSRRAA
ncbi:MAG: septal ring lytic transglycosylase RlpA family protein, partial [Bacteroidota bacterium]